jgi:hypothetical protein
LPLAKPRQEEEKKEQQIVAKPEPGVKVGTYNKGAGKTPGQYSYQKVEFPNKLIYPDSKGFWNQDVINMFICENWTKISQETKEQAFLAMNEYTLRKEQLKVLTKKIQELPDGHPDL